MREPVTAYVALGANVGDPLAALRGALQAIAALPDTEVLRTSRAYRTAPIESSGPDYLNAVTALRTCLTAQELLDGLQAIELASGRERPYRNAPRTLDLDLLLFGDARIFSERLLVPHPRMFDRAFVLVPLAEIAPERVSAAQLAAVADQAITPLPATSLSA